MKKEKPTIIYFRGRRPKGWILAHNPVRHDVDTQHGDRGFRAFYVPPNPEKWVVCPCGWRPHLGVHYAGKSRVTANA
jgi:hypothetical protein